MRYLLDTHIFIWWILDDPHLSVKIRDAITEPANELYLSAASTWEMVIKADLGKLLLPDAPETFIEKHLQVNDVNPLHITIRHALELAGLPNIHKDPFDRMLVVQSRVEKLTLATDDALIKQYDVETLS